MGVEVKGSHAVEVVEQAYKEFMTELFGFVPEDPSTYMVSRKEYTEIMKKVQEKYGLKEGHKDFISWIFTLLGKSPEFFEDDEKESKPE